MDLFHPHRGGVQHADCHVLRFLVYTPGMAFSSKTKTGLSLLPPPRERRLGPRFTVELAVHLVMADGAVLPAHSQNLSISGIQLHCDDWVCDEIEPRGIQRHPPLQRLLHLQIELPGEPPVSVHARLRCLQRLSQSRFSLNFAFHHFEAGSERLLRSFLQRLEHPVQRRRA